MIYNLPDEIINMIFLYMINPEAEIIKKEVRYYLNDHNSEYTKRTKTYYVHKFLSFSKYYFDIRFDPYDYDSYYIRKKNERIHFTKT